MKINGYVTMTILAAILEIRTIHVGPYIVGTTADGKSVGIVCTSGWFSSSADLVFQDRDGNLNLDDYKDRKLTAYGGPRTAYKPMSPEAAAALCDHQGPGEFRLVDNPTEVDIR